MVRAQKNQFKIRKNMLFTLLGQEFFVQTIEETDFRTSIPIALFFRHCRTLPLFKEQPGGENAVRESPPEKCL
jgi:hypothetical protein